MTVDRAFCRRCDKDVRPVVDLGVGGKLIDQCPTCQAPVGEVVAPVRAQGNEALPVVASAPARPRPPAPPLPAADLDVIAILRARANALRAEVSVLKAKEAELETLERMLAVADSPATKN